MFIFLIIIIIGVILYFTCIKTTKCDFCQKESHDTYKVDDKHICQDCLNEKHALGYYKYKDEILCEKPDEKEIEAYNNFYQIVQFETLLQAKDTPKDKSFVMTPNLVITPTFIMSTVYDDLIFRTKEIVAITVDCHWNSKDVANGINGYVITFYINNILAPFLQTVVYGKQKLFKFDSTLEKEVREQLDELFKKLMPPLKTGIPISNFKGLKKYVNENEEALMGKLLNDKFKAADFNKRVDKASNYYFKFLVDNDHSADKDSPATLKALAFLDAEGFGNSIPLVTV